MSKKYAEEKSKRKRFCLAFGFSRAIEIYLLAKIVTGITDSSEFSFTANCCNI